MLPIVQLRHVMRSDVHRIARWLSDDEVSSRWFGHYACGDPVHRGYEPGLMMNASTEDWVRIFDRDRTRLIFSIYCGDEGHIGECQAVFDGDGDVEMSLLIGRKDLWHRGYGAAAALQLLDRIFYDYPVEQAWVSVPQDNVPALRLFSRLGFSVVSDRTLCQAPDGSALKAAIMALPASDYRVRKLQFQSDAPHRSPVVTVTGLPGSGSEHVAAETARLMKAAVVDRQIINEELALRLDRTVGEIEALEASYSSIWARLLRATLEPWERYGAIDPYSDFMATSTRIDYAEMPDYLDKTEYLRGLKDVVGSQIRSGSAVVHSHGALSYVPDDRPAFHVFVEMDLDRRVRKAQLEEKLQPESARRLLRRADKAFVTMHKGLYGFNPLDPRRYDIGINMDRLTVEEAARIVSGAVVRSVAQHRSPRRTLSSGRTLQPA
jgi:cytidylate kinase/RimJ/RimL family protein N-acetyltransferase